MMRAASKVLSEIYNTESATTFYCVFTVDVFTRSSTHVVRLCSTPRRFRIRIVLVKTMASRDTRRELQESGGTSPNKYQPAVLTIWETMRKGDWRNSCRLLIL